MAKIGISVVAVRWTRNGFFAHGVCIERSHQVVTAQKIRAFAVSEMESKEYEVEVVHRQRTVYRVKAAGREEAERLAVEQWQQGEPSTVPGLDWNELQSVSAQEAPEPERIEQDAELVLRFLRERERLILRLGSTGGPATGNDAISAGQVASDLGWTRRGGGEGPDLVRATAALERLCRLRKVICFERPRVRAGERGEIRLYCTPEYLEQLTDSTLDRVERQAV